MSQLAKLAAAALAALLLLPASAVAEEPAVMRKVLERHDLRASGQEGVLVHVELAPGAREGRHTHPAEGFVYVLEGTFTLQIEGQPERTLHAGDTFFLLPGQIHEGLNRGTTPARLVAVFVTEKGKPLTSPVK